MPEQATMGSLPPPDLKKQRETAIQKMEKGREPRNQKELGEEELIWEFNK